MMRRVLYFAISLLSAGVAFAADRLDDAKSLQGTWTPIKAELGGNPVPDAVLKTITLKLDNGKYEASVAGQLDKGTYTLDSANKPNGMTVNGTEGPNKGKSFPAIYELSGDTLRSCCVSALHRHVRIRRRRGFLECRFGRDRLVTFNFHSGDPGNDAST
jgi:uncharacterized protein (TIGR03067 family)